MDLILGHHPHIPKGIEAYKGKPIFYSMGNFAFDFPAKVLKEWAKDNYHLISELKHFGFVLDDPEWNSYAFPPESRKSMIVRCKIENKKIKEVSFLPVLINQRAQPRAVPREDKKFDQLFRYMKETTESQDLKTEFSIEGNEIVVSLK